MTLQRQLDPIEAWQLGKARTQIVEYTGVLDPEAMRRAFAWLGSRFPVLRGRVRREGPHHLLYAAPEHQTRFAVLEGGEDVLLREVERPWDPGRSLAQLVNVQQDGHGWLALRMDHCVVDGTAWTAMFYRLWEVYTDLVKGNGPPAPESGPLPQPPTLLFERHLKRNPYAFLEGPSDEPVPVEATEGRFRLSERETARIVATAREHGTTVHALVCGAVLASHRVHGGGSAAVQRMACLSPVNLRQRVTPPIGATDTTNFLGYHMAEADLWVNPDPVAVGRAVKKQLDAALARRDHLPFDLATFLAARLREPLHQRQSHLSISNLGVIPAFTRPPEVEITDWRGLNGPMPDPFPVYGVYTFERRLSLLYFFPSEFYDDRTVERLAGGAIEQLRSIADDR